MGKILGSFSGMRKYLEEDMLAGCLKGRVTYHCTTYPKMDGCSIFEIRVDGAAVRRFSGETVTKELWKGEKPGGIQEFWKPYWDHVENTPILNRREFDETEFAGALKAYRALPIGNALTDENLLVRMFAVLDRRVGSRTLENCKAAIEDQPEWLQYFYRLRLAAEKMLV